VHPRDFRNGIAPHCVCVSVVFLSNKAVSPWSLHIQCNLVRSFLLNYLDICYSISRCLFLSPHYLSSRWNRFLYFLSFPFSLSSFPSPFFILFFYLHICMYMYILFTLIHLTGVYTKLDKTICTRSPLRGITLSNCSFTFVLL